MNNMFQIRLCQWLAGIVLTISAVACTDTLESITPGISGEKQVQVSMPIGIADELCGTNPEEVATTKSGSSAFDVQPQIVLPTRANTDKPAALYNLEICQYNANGVFQKYVSIASINSGNRFTFTLNALDHCQLVFLVRGKSNSMPSINGKSLQDVQKISMVASTITDATSLDDMPYILHLKDVNISDGKIKSPEGKDVRILLKRLAAELTLSWTLDKQLTDKGYFLTEVRLMQVPANYFVLPERETIDPYGVMYPISTSEFVDGFRLKGSNLTAAMGNKTLWIPANARGTRSDVTNPYYRDKERAHSAATYVEFVVDKMNTRLLYRAYLGGNETNDFNLLENTNYVWNITLKSDNYVSDSRIQLLDQTPVTSSNELTTSNCFMMQPGTNFCFNPYLHEAGTDGQNTYLSAKTIDKVEVLWQSKDAGTSGDLVMGYAGKDNQKNLVNYTDIGDRTKARVHVKLPNTKGGNAVIAAYNASNAIVWSWHLWISDYVPARINNSAINSSTAQTAQLNTARAASVGGTVHQYGGTAWAYNTGNFYDKVIMDRALGALRNTYSETNALESARAYGNLYQWGRKDPMPGSADGGRDDVDLMFDGNGVSKTLDKNSNGTLDLTIQHPDAFYKSLALPSGWASGNKSIYDPCPSGWKIPDFQKNVTAKDIFADFSWSTLRMLTALGWGNQNVSISESIFNIRNGMEYTTPAGDKAWFPFFRMRETGTGLLRDPYRDGQSGENIAFRVGLIPAFTMYSAAHVSSDRGYYVEFKYAPPANDYGSIGKSYGFSIRCVQDNKDGK